MPKWTSLATPIAATFSKDARFFAADFTPAELIEGQDSHVFDGSQYYLDWVSALGANLCGYPREFGPGSISSEITRRVTTQLWQGAGFSLPHVLEAQVAEKIVTLFGQRVHGWTPEGLGVRFGLSGTDATTMAIRLARAVTGRSDVLMIEGQYHGWADWSIGTTWPAWGVPSDDYTDTCPWDDLGRLKDRLESEMPCAAVIIEHPMLNPSDDYYREMRRLCDENRVLLIMDEVVTWPRWALGGASAVYGIEPDIICLGKGLGNGIPISCIVGRREYFDWFAREDPCFASSTHWGNAVSLAAADAVLDLFGDEQVAHIWRIGQALMDGLLGAGFRVIGHPPRFLIDFVNLSEKTYFVLGIRDRGILWNRPTLPNLAHTMEDVERTVEAARQIQVEMEQTDVEAAMADRLPMVLFSNR